MEGIFSEFFDDQEIDLISLLDCPPTPINNNNQETPSEESETLPLSDEATGPWLVWKLRNGVYEETSRIDLTPLCKRTMHPYPVIRFLRGHPDKDTWIHVKCFIGDLKEDQLTERCKAIKQAMRNLNSQYFEAVFDELFIEGTTYDTKRKCFLASAQLVFYFDHNDGKLTEFLRSPKFPVFSKSENRQKYIDSLVAEHPIVFSMTASYFDKDKEHYVAFIGSHLDNPVFQPHFVSDTTTAKVTLCHDKRIGKSKDFAFHIVPIHDVEEKGFISICSCTNCNKQQSFPVTFFASSEK